jgi:hypothetical protein
VDLPVEPPTREQPLKSLALYRTADGPRLEIEVVASLLSREVAPADWLDIYLEQVDEQVLNRREVPSPGGAVADVLTRRAGQDEAVISRWLAIKDGARVFLLQARTMEENYPQFTGACLMAVGGLQLLHPGDWPLAERLRTFTRREPGDFLLIYPESWQLVEDPSSNPNALVLQLNNDMDGIAGKITFATVARSAESHPQTLADNYHGELARGASPCRPGADAIRPGRRLLVHLACHGRCLPRSRPVRGPPGCRPTARRMVPYRSARPDAIHRPEPMGHQ